MDPETIGLTILAAAEVPNFLAGLLPSKMTIARFAADDEDVYNLHRAMWVGSGLSLALGVGASLIAKSWLPFLACAAVLFVMLHEYTDALNNPHPDVVGIDQHDGRVA